LPGSDLTTIMIALEVCAFRTQLKVWYASGFIYIERCLSPVLSFLLSQTFARRLQLLYSKMTASTIKTVTLRNRGDYVEHHMLGVQHHSTSTSIGLLTVKLEPLRSCSMSVWLTYNNDRTIKVISTWLSHSFKRTAEKLSRHIVKIFFCLVNHAEVLTVEIFFLKLIIFLLYLYGHGPRVGKLAQSTI
jgi:hypothetical protein